MTAPATSGGLTSGGGATNGRPLTARRIAEIVGGRVEGDADAEASAVAPLDRATAGSLSFLGNPKYASQLESCDASVVLVTPELATTPGRVSARVVVAAPQEALLQLVPMLYPPRVQLAGVDATARIGRGATIGAGVSIGPYAVIGEGARIGARVRLDAHAVVGAGVEVGDDSHIYSGATLYPGSVLGQRVIVHAGARVACDGFGYVTARGEHQKIPHVGRCVVEDDVEVGANTTIDRGSIGDTVIGAGTKIDNLVQIGHNVRIGRGCLLASQVGIAGSTRIGDGCVFGGQVGIAGHLTIGDGVRLGAQAGVIGDIPNGETWSGYPARPHREALRAQGALFKLPALLRRLQRVVGDAE